MELLLIVLLILLAVLIVWGNRQRIQAKILAKKYEKIKDIDEYCNEVRVELKNAEETYQQKRSQLEREINELEEEYKYSEQQLAEIQNQIAIASEEKILLDFGYYEPNYGFQTDGEWSQELEEINGKIKEMIKNVQKFGTKQAVTTEEKCAGYIIDAMTFNNSLSKGKAMQISSIKLILRAFNGECGAHIARVNYKNVNTMIQRIEKAYKDLNVMGEKSNKVRISEVYKNLKIEELGCVYEYEEWKQREKEEQQRIKEQIREEEKAVREIEKAKRLAEEEAKRYAKALKEARQQVESANDNDRKELLQQIEELTRNMQELEKKNEYISQAMLTKTGHVYIISNIGSFGENIFKIGMTRRLEPLDRVKELGDASVPFPFDVHALIRTSDAPALENALHKHFDDRRLNLENYRKEFFHVSIDEIKDELEILKTELGIDSELQLTMIAEAKQWRMSVAKRRTYEHKDDK